MAEKEIDKQLAESLASIAISETPCAKKAPPAQSNEHDEAVRMLIENLSDLVSRRLAEMDFAELFWLSATRLNEAQFQNLVVSELLKMPTMTVCCETGVFVTRHGTPGDGRVDLVVSPITDAYVIVIELKYHGMAQVDTNEKFLRVGLPQIPPDGYLTHKMWKPYCVRRLQTFSVLKLKELYNEPLEKLTVVYNCNGKFVCESGQTVVRNAQTQCSNYARSVAQDGFRTNTLLNKAAMRKIYMATICGFGSRVDSSVTSL